MADTAKCPKCGVRFDIPKKSTESAGDWESWAEWAIKDIRCPECNEVVFKKSENISEYNDS